MLSVFVPVVVSAVLITAGCDRGDGTQDRPGNIPEAATVKPLPVAGYTGSRACAGCHEEAAAAWENSHHDLAMQPATAETVLGDFDNASYTYNGIETSFFSEGGRFGVRTDGPDGLLHDYTVEYTFGVEPLQQYLIELADGRLQALGIAWDSRPPEAGGRRWFHLYPGQAVDHTDALHWTGLQQNWNFMCAECHSTDLKKNYDESTNQFTTGFSEIDVACEACHGPGSGHVAWANGETSRAGVDDDSKGLRLRFDELQGVAWKIDPGTGNAVRSAERGTGREIEVCARCHSRRGRLSEDYIHGRPVGDTHRVSLLEEALYFPDGQPRDETYVYGSFLQSRMYHNGVTCSDCHEPHSLKLRAQGDRVCLQCHAEGKFASPDHHFHPSNTAGPGCIECHMPVRTFMVVDARHDHSFRIPRPDLSVTLGTPNACTDCHRDRTAQWAAAQVEAWYGRVPTGFQQYAELLRGARSGDPDYRDELRRFVQDAQQPGIARATAVAYLPGYPGQQAAAILSALVADKDPLVRRAAAEALNGADRQTRMRLLGPLLSDDIRDVRISAARAMAGIPAHELSAGLRRHLDLATKEYIAAQTLNADRPDAHLNLGNLYRDQGDALAAEAAYRRALELDAGFVPAVVNLSDLYRATGREDEGETLLRDSLAGHPEDAALNHGYGLLLVRRQKLDQALGYLERAAGLAPDETRYAYVYAIALHGTGKPGEAVRVLENQLEKHPYERDSLRAVYSIYRETGRTDKAGEYLERLLRIEPEIERRAGTER